MTAQTINGRVHPPGLDELLPTAIDLAITLDRVPSLDVLRRELSIGYDKAKPLQDELYRREREYAERLAVAVSPDQSDLEPPEQLIEPEPLVAEAVRPVPAAARTVSIWPLLGIGLPAFIAIWSGWVGMGGLTGFGVVHPLPGIWDGAKLNTAITLPIGMETYATYALRVWLSPWLPAAARRFAKWSCIVALGVGMSGMAGYHLMVAAGLKSAPWQITTLVSCLPVAVLGMGAALAHLVRRTEGASS
jgi:hypothetical protein